MAKKWTTRKSQRSDKKKLFQQHSDKVKNDTRLARTTDTKEMDAAENRRRIR